MQQGNRVFVLNMRGEPLMPCSQRKARILLKEGKAIINKYNPFTIQLTYATGESRQDCQLGDNLGVDAPFSGPELLIFKLKTGEVLKGKYYWNETFARRWIAEDGREFTSDLVAEWEYLADL